MSNVRFIGLDVHAETIGIAVAEPDGEVRSVGVIPNRPESIRKLVKKLGPAEQLRVCYEAGPTGYVLYWELTTPGVKCEVVAPTLDELPPDRTTRFVMTQCFSGVFQGLICDDPKRSAGFQGSRCGFMSESALREAEGCDLGVDEEEFRDYSTYFFAALAGKTRLGAPLDLEKIDRDNDGVVNYREAHFSALVAAHSTDLSRSTSEEYLERWTPRYLHWDGLGRNTGSVYWTLANEVARRLGWDPTPRRLERLRRGFTERQRLGAARQRVLEEQVDALQGKLKTDLMVRWPELSRPYGAAYRQLLTDHSQTVDEYLLKHVGYGQLKERQESLHRAQVDALEITRSPAQIDKIYRLRNLARLEQRLSQYGSRRARDEYRRLVQCEAGGLG